MKKIFLFFILPFLASSIAAQEYVRPSDDEAKEKISEFMNRSHQSVENKDYRNAVQILTDLNDWLSYYQKNDPDWWILDQAYAGSYYDIACFLSLAGETDDSLDALERAVDYGWNSFRHAMNDSDLDNVRNHDKFRELIERMRETGDYLAILKGCGAYRREDTSGYPEFTYEPVGNGRIQNVRHYLGLDSVVGKGDEISQIKNLMTYVHNLIPHDGSHWAHCMHTAVDLYNYSKANDNRGINCRHLAIVLNDCYHAMGFKSRFVTCMPKDENDGDCHVINAVWSKDLGRWVWMDPTFNAWVTDENGELLGIKEVRERMRDGRLYFLNEEANWNNVTPQTKEHYLDEYMAKNLYWLQQPAASYFAVESPYFNSNWQYLGLVPEGYQNPDYAGGNNVTTSDDEYFWQPPVFED